MTERTTQRAAPDRARSLRWLWFLGLWLMLPWPIVAFGDTFVPAVRYAILASVASLVAITQGSSGPVLLIVTLFAVMTVATTLFCWGIAWSVDRLLARLPEPVHRGVTWIVLGAALLWALFASPYRTHFGRSARGGLIEILS